MVILSRCHKELLCFGPAKDFFRRIFRLPVPRFRLSSLTGQRRVDYDLFPYDRVPTPNAHLDRLSHIQYDLIGVFFRPHRSEVVRARLSNCLWLFSFLSLGCHASEPGVKLVVVLRTDFQPLREFAAVNTFVDGQGVGRNAVVDGEYVRPGQEVAEIAGLSPDHAREVTVQLSRLGGELLVESTVTIDNGEDAVIHLRDHARLSGRRLSARGW